MKILSFEDGVAGGTALDVDHLLALGNAFGQSHKKVLLGRWSDDPDTLARERALEAGMTAAGSVVMPGGCLPRPLLSFLARENSIGATVTVLGDSVRFRAEDPGWISAFRGGKEFLSPLSGDAVTPLKPLTGYLRRLAQVADIDVIKERKFKVALSAEGAAKTFAGKVLSKLDCEITEGDQSAIPVVLSPDGTILRLGNFPPELTVRMAFEHILEAYPGNVVLAGHDRVVEEIIRSCGCECQACGGTESLLLDAMHSQNAWLGGSITSGMVIWRRFQPGADGILVMVLILEMLALSGQHLKEIAASMR